MEKNETHFMFNILFSVSLTVFEVAKSDSVLAFPDFYVEQYFELSVFLDYSCVFPSSLVRVIGSTLCMYNVDLEIFVGSSFMYSVIS
jgi:hypothetical protein